MTITDLHTDLYTIASIDQLEALFGEVGEASRKKEVDHIHPVYRSLIEASPFAIQRSNLWQPIAQGAPRRVPSPGSMLAALTHSAIDGNQYDRDLPERQRSTLY